MSTEITVEEVNALIDDFEATYPDFPETWATPGCPCCKPDWNTWSYKKINAWWNYRSCRWMRGDREPSGVADV